MAALRTDDAAENSEEQRREQRRTDEKCANDEEEDRGDFEVCRQGVLRMSALVVVFWCS
jgi:hypothetical protein